MHKKVATISCCIIGDDSLSAACAEYLLARGDKIVGICTLAPILIEWANKHNIKILNTLEELALIATREPFDYLFSIANKKILPDNILILPIKLAINFHNAPLPKYSGAHPTAWAILNHEQQFGITWHVMSKIIDGGDILRQKVVLISERDTTATLNIKCYDAAIETFKKLIDDLANDNVTRVKQQIKQRLYFKANTKPPGDGIISFDRSAEEIYDLFRALNFGKNDNTFALPKIMLGDTFFIVNNLEIAGTASLAVPGTIIACSKQYIQVSTKTKDVIIKNLINMTGNQSSIKHIIKQFDLKPNDVLLTLSDEELLNIQQYSEATHKDEKFWLKALLERQDNVFNKLIMPAVENINFDRELKYHTSDIIDFEKEDYIQDIANNTPINEQYYVLLTIILIYFYRLNNYENYTTNIGGHTTYLEGIYQHLYATHVPVTTNFKPQDSFYEALSKVTSIMQTLCARTAFAKDIYWRYTELNIDAINKFLSIFMVADFDETSYVQDTLVALIIHKTKKQCKLRFVDNKNTPFFLKNMPSHIMTLGIDVYRTPHKELKDFQILSNNEYKKVIVQYNATAIDHAKNQSIIELFEQQVNETPYQIAIRFYEEAIDYITLHKKANQLAHYLIKLGVKPGALIAIAIARSPEMIIAVLATLKAGATYVPIDINCPRNGIQYILNDCKPQMFLTTEKIYNNMLNYDISLVGFKEIINLTMAYPDIQLGSEESPKVAVSANDVAYIIYTSGTTGQAKGVEVTHKSLVNLVHSMRLLLNINTSTRMLLFSSFSFDGSVWEIFNALSLGATLCLAKDKDLLPVEPLIKTLKSYEITLVVLPAAVLNLLPYIELPALKTLFSVGESCTKEIIKNWANKVNLINGYGPTEATVCTAIASCKSSSSPKCIGKPIYNARVYVLDLFTNPLPIGIPGEICIGGAVLARGYLSQDELTKQRFIIDPFDLEKKNKIYRTGDFGYWSPNGNLYCLGRTDKQVKIRGFRIELGSIEIILKQHPLVNNCVVTVKTTPNNSAILIAYIVATKQMSSNSYLLREYLKEYLPEYMIPPLFVFLDKIPLSNSGKVAINALPVPDERERLSSALYVEPRTDLEKQLENIWLKVLSLNKIGVYDDFFHVGGHSLLIAQLLLMVNKELNTNISLHDFLVKPTIEHMAGLILEREYNNKTQEKKTKSSQLKDLKYGLDIINKIGKTREFPIKSKVKAILLTGVTGFLGKYILYELCKYCAPSTKIYCLIRDKNIEQAEKRLKSVLQSALFNDLSKETINNIMPVLGDLSKNLLGLTQTCFKNLAKEIDIIYHVGAYVNHLYNYEQLREPNVIGTLELINFAAQYKIKKISYISVLSAITETSDDGIVAEDFIKQNNSIFNVADGYSQTKWVSEVLLGCTKNIGIPVDIFRLGWVIWDEVTDVATIKNNHLYSLIDACMQLGYAPNWKTTLNLTPVKFIGQFVARSGLEKNTKHRFFNLVNPNTMDWHNMINSFADKGTDIRYISPKQWHKKCLLFFGKHNMSFPFLPLYLDVEKSIRLKAPDLGNQIQHKAADKQAAKLNMQYPIVLPFKAKQALKFFELPSYLQKYSFTLNQGINRYLLETS